jgi:hypothetical protein
MGVHEFKHYRVRKDIAQWTPMLRWLHSRIITPLDEQAVMPGNDAWQREQPERTPLSVVGNN